MCGRTVLRFPTVPFPLINSESLNIMCEPKCCSGLGNNESRGHQDRVERVQVSLCVCVEGVGRRYSASNTRGAEVLKHLLVRRAGFSLKQRRAQMHVDTSSFVSSHGEDTTRPPHQNRTPLTAVISKRTTRATHERQHLFGLPGVLATHSAAVATQKTPERSSIRKPPLPKKARKTQHLSHLKGHSLDSELRSESDWCIHAGDRTPTGPKVML